MALWVSILRRRSGMLVQGLLVFLLSTFMIYMFLQRGHSSKSLELFDDGDMKIYVQDNRDQEAHGVLLSPSTPKLKIKGKFAFVSLMCDETWLPQARVLAYSWKRSKSNFPLVFLVHPWAVGHTADLEAIGASIHRVDYLDVPFRRKNGKRMAFDKACRYSKIHAWTLTQFERAVYLDPTLLITANIDELFQYPEFSAVKVVGDEFNTGLFVFEPNQKTHSQMLTAYLNSPPAYRGEEGFFNWFFHSRKTHVISARYNTDYAVWTLLKRSAKVFHFSPGSAPWNFHQYPHPEFDSNFEPTIFGYWNLIHQQALQHLQIDEFSANNTWPNAKRVPDICNSMTSMYNPKRFGIINKFSVLIGTWDRVSMLRKVIIHYQKSRLVHKIYVTWHNPSVKPPEDFQRLVRRKPPVEILPQKYDSLNNRFNPIPNLETKAVLVCDDDIRVNVTDLEYAFEVWKNRPQALVGAFPRYHSFNAANKTYNYEIRSPERPRQYSIMLTKFMFMSSDFLYDYTCLLPAKIHRYIDEHMNCEDIAMNLMVSGMSGSRPVAVMLNVDDFGTTTGISLKSGHLSNRSNCMTDLIGLFGRDTLRYNREVFYPFRRRRPNAVA